ncbi:MAG: MBL fold metallo-hydrolase RNA specificity domain-containing protein, partial [Candidatus Dormibacteria bacterium]
STRNKVHVSGHAAAGDLKIVLNLVRPKFFVPIHGEDRHLAHHRMLAREVGLGEANVMVASDGAVIELAHDRFVSERQVEAGYVFVDGLGIGDVGSVVLRDRRHLGQDGIFVVMVTVDRTTGAAIGRPDVVTRGFIHPDTSDQLLESAKDRVLESLGRLREEPADQALLQNHVRDVVSKHLYEQTRRRPMVIPVVVEV